jgi:hypothetical protein
VEASHPKFRRGTRGTDVSGAGPLQLSCDLGFIRLHSILTPPQLERTGRRSFCTFFHLSPIIRPILILNKAWAMAVHPRDVHPWFFANSSLVPCQTMVETAFHLDPVVFWPVPGLFGIAVPGGLKQPRTHRHSDEAYSRCTYGVLITRNGCLTVRALQVQLFSVLFQCCADCL